MVRLYFVLFLCILTLIQAQEQPKESFKEIIPQLQDAVERGLSWLARSQSRDGSYGNGSAPVATTALAGLAFLAGGHAPGRSKYGDNVKKCIEYLLKCTQRSGYINEGGTRGAGGSGMHGHGYAVLLLAEAYGMTGSIPDIDTKTLKEKLTKAIRVIEQAQSANGGWYYEPSPGMDEGSVTVTQVAALRSARNAGIAVNLNTINKAIDYINKSTDENGMTHYSLASRGHTTFALTAAGMSVINLLGQYNNPKLEKGLSFILQNRPGKQNDQWNRGWNFYYYANFYATIATYQVGGKYWQGWFPMIRDDLMKTQASNGSWTNYESQQYGPAFGTGFALLILQMPYRYLPIFQRTND